MDQWEMDLREVLSELRQENKRLHDRLTRVAGILAETGIIHNTPAAIATWVSGK